MSKLIIRLDLLARTIKVRAVSANAVGRYCGSQRGALD